MRPIVVIVKGSRLPQIGHSQEPQPCPSQWRREKFPLSSIATTEPRGHFGGGLFTPVGYRNFLVQEDMVNFLKRPSSGLGTMLDDEQKVGQ